MIVKVKEPRPEEFPRIRPRADPLHLLPLCGGRRADARDGEDPGLLHRLRDGRTPQPVPPLLTPMSEVAGQPQHPRGGRSILSGRWAGQASSSRRRPGHQARDRRRHRRGHRHQRRENRGGLWGHGVRPGHQPRPVALPRRHLSPERHHAPQQPRDASPGAPRSRRWSAPSTLPGCARSRARHARDARNHEAGGVIVDVCVDQGGCFETTRPTTTATLFTRWTASFTTPLRTCLERSPARAPTPSLTLPYVLKLADHGLGALNEDSGFAKASMSRLETWQRSRPSPVSTG